MSSSQNWALPLVCLVQPSITGFKISVWNWHSRNHRSLPSVGRRQFMVLLLLAMESLPWDTRLACCVEEAGAFPVSVCSAIEVICLQTLAAFTDFGGLSCLTWMSLSPRPRGNISQKAVPATYSASFVFGVLRQICSLERFWGLLTNWLQSAFSFRVLWCCPPHLQNAMQLLNWHKTLVIVLIQHTI